MSYKLFTRGDCPSCADVKAYLKSSKIPFEHIDLDSFSVPEASYVKIVPALFKEERLMAYGSDIIAYLSVQQKLTRSA